LLDRYTEEIQFSTHHAYHCDDELLPAAIRVINVVQSGNYHPVDYQPPFCAIADEFVYLPSEPEFGPTGRRSGWRDKADLIKTAQDVFFQYVRLDC
jgi:hypothetical protein